MPAFDPIFHENPPDDMEVLDRLAKEARAQLKENPRVPSAWPAEAIEIGSWAGSSALVLAKHFDHVYCVDHWLGNPADRLGPIAQVIGAEGVFQTFCDNMGDLLYRKIIPCRGESRLYASIWPRPVALVFIDASHEYNDVRRDILLWRRHLIPGGILCGHDYGGFEGVTKAVNELFPPEKRHTGGTCMWWTTIP